MRVVAQTNAFIRDLKKIRKRKKNLEKLDLIVEKLVKSQKLDFKHKAHKLSGNYADKWECHIEPDWLLVYEVTEELVILYRTGSHADLF